MKVIINRNTRKQSDKQPDWRGKITLEDGTHVHDISLWERDGKFGTFLSGVIQEPYKKPEEAVTVDSASKKMKAEEDDLPF